MKKLLVLMLAVCMVFVLSACGSYSYTSTTTTTTTDADGNTTTTTTTSSSDSGDVTVTCEEAAEDGENHTASLNIINNADLDIEGLYIALPENDSWGDNCIDEPIQPGDDTFDRDYTMTYNADCLEWEIAVVDSEGIEHYFDWDLSLCDAESLNVEFSSDADGWMINFW